MRNARSISDCVISISSKITLYSEASMSTKKFKILETYRCMAVVSFDLPKPQIAFTFQIGANQIIVGWHLLCFVISTNMILWASIYFDFCEATTFVEFSNTFFPIITAFVSICSCTLQITLRSKIIDLIDDLEMVIEARKWTFSKQIYIYESCVLAVYALSIVGIQRPESKILYEKSNAFVQKWTNIVYYFLSKLAVPSLMSIFIFSSYFLYFIVELKENAFHLPFVTWYVSISLSEV